MEEVKSRLQVTRHSLLALLGLCSIITGEIIIVIVIIIINIIIMFSL